MNIVIPMAGLGSRFTNSGFPLTKPLIPVNGKPMYQHAVNCLPLELASNLVFIIRKDKDAHALEKDIQSNYGFVPKLSIIVLEDVTQGQAETVFLAVEKINMDKSTLIHNCDTFIEKKIPWTSIINQDIDGAIVLFSSQEPRWSYVQLNENELLSNVVYSIRQPSCLILQ